MNPMNADERAKSEFLSLLEEYKACRAEILEHLKFQAQAVGIGATFIIAIASASVGTWTKIGATTDDKVLIAWLLLSVPLISFLVGMWMVHKESMLATLGLYISAYLKNRIDAICSSTRIKIGDVIF